MMPSQLYPEGGYEVNQVWLWLKNPYSTVLLPDAAAVCEYYRYVCTTWAHIEQCYALFEGCVLEHSTFDMAEAQCTVLSER